MTGYAAKPMVFSVARIGLSPLIQSQEGENLMISNSILARFLHKVRVLHGKRLDLHTAWSQPERLPGFVRECPVAIRLLDLIGPLAWDQFPERNLMRDWGCITIPYTAKWLNRLRPRKILYLQRPWRSENSTGLWFGHHRC
jgi:hypothetical protein